MVKVPKSMPLLIVSRHSPVNKLFPDMRFEEGFYLVVFNAQAEMVLLSSIVEGNAVRD